MSCINKNLNYKKIKSKLADLMWEKYRAREYIGKLCYHYCTKQSHLPIRDILGNHGQGTKVEPNYETDTYNCFYKCNQPSVESAIQNGLSHILFITKYTGLREKYHNRYFIVGYYKIGWTAKINGRYVIKAEKKSFVPIETAYEVTPKIWRSINRYGITKSLQNLRHATQRIIDPILTELLHHLDKFSINKDYHSEIIRLNGIK